MESFFEYFSELISDWNVFITKLLLTLGLVLGVWLITRIINRILDTQVDSSSKSIMGHHLLRLIATLIMLVGIIIIWFASYDGIGVFFLIFFAFVALGVKDIALDVMAFIYILMRHPFSIKDYIGVQGHLGQVIDMDLLQFHLEEFGANLSIITPTGKFISLPNRVIFQQPVINYSHDHDMLKMEESILIAFGQDTDKALEIAEEIAQEAFDQTFKDIDPKRIFYFNRHLKEHGVSVAPIVWVDREDVAYRLHILYSTPISRIFRNQRFIQMALQQRLTQAGIEILVPTAIEVMQP